MPPTTGDKGGESGGAGGQAAQRGGRATQAVVHALTRSKPVVWLKRKGKVAGAIIRQHPSTLVVPVIMLCVMLAVGLWGTIWGTNRFAEQQKQQAQGFADAYLANYQHKVQQIIATMELMNVIIRRNPSTWAGLNASLVASADDLVKVGRVEAGIFETIYIAPQARVSLQLATTPLPQGVDYLEMGSSTRPGVLSCILGRGPFLVGPWSVPVLPQIIPGVLPTFVLYSMPVYVSAPPNVEWLPSDVPRATNCTGACAMNEAGEVFWGLVGAGKRIEQFIEPGVFSRAGYAYVITAPTRNQRVEDENGPTTDISYIPLVVGQSASGVNDPVEANVSMDASTAQWKLYVSPESGTWQPDWRGPMIAVVVVVSVALATMQFIALLAWRQHSMLLVSLLPENVLKRLHSEHDFAANPAESAMMTSGTPAEMMLRLLSSMMQDETPDLREMVLVRTTLMRGADVYQPLDLTAKIKAASGLNSDVARALARVLDNTYPTHGDGTLSSASTTASVDAFPSSVHGPDFTSLRAALVSIAFDRTEPDVGEEGERTKDLTQSEGADSSTPAGEVPDEKQDGLKCRSSPALQSSRSQQPRFLAALTAPLSVAVDGEVPTPQAPDSVANTGGVMISLQDDSPVGKPAKGSMDMVQFTKQPKLDTLERQLAVSSEWAFDAMALAEASNGRPLSTLGFYLLSTTDLMNTFKLKGTVLARFLTRVESLYIDNPYHSATHAADVLQSMHVLLQRGGIAAMCTEPLGQLACYVAAVVHDLGHLGRTNDFLCATSHDLAVRYNDRAPLENHHVSMAFELLRDPDLNFLAPLTRQQLASLRRTVIELVLSTDMKQHFSVVSQFKTLHGGAINATRDSSARPTASRGQLRITLDGQAARRPSEKGNRNLATPPPPQLDDAGKLLTLQFTLKCADLGHLSSPLPVHLRWVASLEEEYFRQGDAEKEASLPVSPLFDRSKPGITKSQVGFFNFVVLPQFHTLAAALPAMQPLRDAVDANYHYWQEHERKEKEKEQLREQEKAASAQGSAAASK